MLEAIPPESGRARARSARARAHPRLSNIAGVRLGFLLILLRCCSSRCSCSCSAFSRLLLRLLLCLQCSTLSSVAFISDVFIVCFLFGCFQVFLGARDARSDPATLAALASLFVLVRSLASRASRSMIARFWPDRGVGGFFSFFLKNFKT